MTPEYNDVESAILTTLVVENKQSINRAVNKINGLYSDAYKQKAIAFADWILKEGYHSNNGYWWFDSDYYTTEQLYQIYKNKQP